MKTVSTTDSTKAPHAKTAPFRLNDSFLRCEFPAIAARRGVTNDATNWSAFLLMAEPTTRPTATGSAWESARKRLSWPRRRYRLVREPTARANARLLAREASAEI